MSTVQSELLNVIRDTRHESDEKSKELEKAKKTVQELQTRLDTVLDQTELATSLGNEEKAYEMFFENSLRGVGKR